MDLRTLRNEVNTLTSHLDKDILVLVRDVLQQLSSK